MAVIALRAVLAIQFISLAIYLVIDIKKHHLSEMRGNSARYLKNGVIGLVTDFFDTLGIGCFAPTMFAFQTLKSMPTAEDGSMRDDLVPGTMNIGHCWPVITEALLFMDFVEVEPLTLVGLLVAAAVGGIAGAGWVSKWSVNTVRYALSICLLGTAVIVIMRQFKLGPYAGSDDAVLLGLHGAKLIIALALNFLFGVLMNLGFGLYAPCMAMLLVLGMDIGACFPIMMGSTAIQMPFSSVVFIKQSKYDPIATVMLGICGIIGVLIAYFVVKSMDTTLLLYLVICVMIYTAITYFNAARKSTKAAKAAK